MDLERIELRVFLGEALELLGTAIPDETIFTCRFDADAEVQIDPVKLRQLLGELIAAACEGGADVQLRTGTVAGRSGPHAFIEVSRRDAGTRVVVPVPVYRPREMRLAGDERPQNIGQHVAN